MNVAAAVDVHGGAGEIAGVLAGEERHDGGDLLGGGRPPDRDAGGQRGLGFIGGADPDVGVDRAGRDGVDGHSRCRRSRGRAPW